MSQPPIDATRIVLRTLRWLDDTRKAATEQWERWTKPDTRPAEPPDDRRQPPDVW